MRQSRNRESIAHGIHCVADSLDNIAKSLRHRIPHSGTLRAGIQFVRITKEVEMQTLPLKRSINSNHAVLLMEPVDKDGNPVDLATLGVPVSSDTNVSNASLKASGTGFDLSTEVDAGTVRYTFNPDGFEGIEFDFEYGPLQVGHLNPSFGDDEPDA